MLLGKEDTKYFMPSWSIDFKVCCQSIGEAQPVGVVITAVQQYCDVSKLVTKH